MRYTECRCRQQIAWGAEQRAERGEDAAGNRNRYSSSRADLSRCQNWWEQPLSIQPNKRREVGEQKTGVERTFFFFPCLYREHLNLISSSSSILLHLSHHSLTPLHAFLSSYCTVCWIARLSGCHGKHHHVHLQLQVHLYHTICIPPFSSHLTVHFGLRRMDDG